MSTEQDKSVAAATVNVEIVYAQALRALSIGDEPTAEILFRKVCEFDVNDAEAAANLGFLLNKKGAYEEAEQFLRQAIGADRRCAEAYLNLGGLLTTTRRYKEAEVVCKEAVALRPLSPLAWSNLGACLDRVHRESEAEQCFRTAMSLSASHQASRFNLGCLLLRQGQYEEGWACFEVRDWYGSVADSIPCPRWRGEPLAGKHLLITYEAGHGDMIQFVRYAREVKAHFQPKDIDILCHPALVSLFANQGIFAQVFAFNAPVESAVWDYWVPPLSLPYWCETRLNSIPASLPYLTPALAKITQWLARLPAVRPRVGLVWKGSVGFENDAARSLASLSLLSALADFSGISFVSLQKGAGEEELEHPPFSLTALGGEFSDFADTAAVISQLDLVISVDTAVAHLTGALGIPVWILLPAHMTDWRWLNDRDDSPWYPEVAQLFRQKPGETWEPVIARLYSALAARFPETLKDA